MKARFWPQKSCRSSGAHCSPQIVLRRYQTGAMVETVKGSRLGLVGQGLHLGTMTGDREGFLMVH